MLLFLTFMTQSSDAQILSGLLSASQKCIAGGEGSSACSISLGGGAGATIVGSGGNGSANITLSTTCRVGYYACCGLSGAKCKEEKKKESEEK